MYSLNRTKLLMQNFAFPFKFQLVLVDLGSQRKNMALKNFDFVRGRRYRRFKNDDFQIDPSISRDSHFSNRNILLNLSCLDKSFRIMGRTSTYPKICQKVQPFWTTFLAITAVHMIS